MAEMTQEKIDEVAHYINDENLALIQKFVDTNTKWPMTGKDIFKTLQKDKDFIGDVTEASFCGALSCNVRSGYIVGVVGRKAVGYTVTARAQLVPRPPPKEKGKRGGRRKSSPDASPAPFVPKTTDQPIVKFAAKKTSTPEPVAEFAQAAPIPSPVTTTNVVPQASGFDQPFRYKYARCVWIGRKLLLVPKSHSMIDPLLNVVGAKQADDGELVIAGKRYHTDHMEIVERFLKTYFYALEKGEYDPVLVNEDGLSVEMRISAGETHVPASVFT